VTRTLRYDDVTRRMVARPYCSEEAGRRTRIGQWYVVKRGDTLWDIAERHYGRGSMYRTVVRANRFLRQSQVLYPCQRVFLPRRT
jgi:nucleoid-associated protein YgaU